MCLPRFHFSPRARLAVLVAALVVELVLCWHLPVLLLPERVRPVVKLEALAECPHAERVALALAYAAVLPEYLFEEQRSSERGSDLRLAVSFARDGAWAYAWACLKDAVRGEDYDACFEPDWIECVLVEGRHIWLGTRELGLYRYDRQSQQMEEVPDLYPSVEDIRREDGKLFVTHGWTGSRSICQVHFSPDDGKTWTHYLEGDDSAELVPLAGFTNQGHRTPRLERVIAALRTGYERAETEDCLRLGDEVYFTLRVNTHAVYAFYRYDLDTDRLTDLDIPSLDPGATGAREFHPDAFQPNFLWVLTTRSSGAWVGVGRWLLYERKERRLTDTIVDLSDEDALVITSGYPGPASERIRFRAKRVEFLGYAKPDPEGEPVWGVQAEYDRTTRTIKWRKPKARK